MGVTTAKSPSDDKVHFLQKIRNFVFLILYAIYSYANLIFRYVVSPRMKSLDGEIFLITGSSSGIGKAVVLNLARHHPKTTLVLWDNNSNLNRETAAEAKAFGATVYAYDVDVTDKEKVRITAKKVQEEVGDVSILFNNAGVAFGSAFLTCPEEDLEKTIQVNLISHFWTIRAFLPKMIANNHGHLVTTGSVGSFFGHKSCLPYFAAKFAIRGYLESLIDELRSLPQNTDNVHVTTIFPGFVETPLTVKSKTAVGVGNKAYLKADYVAEKIVEGIRQNQENVIIPRIAEALIFIKGIMPSQLFWKIRQYVVSNNRKTGHLKA